MRRVAYLEPSKETENKHRGQQSTLIRGVSIYLYVPKERVPKPWLDVLQFLLRSVHLVLGMLRVLLLKETPKIRFCVLPKN